MTAVLLHTRDLVTFFSILVLCVASQSLAGGGEEVAGGVRNDTYRQRTRPRPIDRAGNSKQPFAFQAVWNVGNSFRCQELHGVDLNLQRYGIASNPPPGAQGDVVVLFEHRNFGTYPFITAEGKFNYGGLPQSVNMTAHLRKATKDIAALIPNENYSGLAVIDWEFWNPVWEKSDESAYMRVYYAASLALVRRRHPDWAPGVVEAVARVDFENAARRLMEDSLALATALRPRAKWGFYHVPHCNRDRAFCGNATSDNDQLTWLADASSALYPSIYLNNNYSETATYVKSSLNESIRLRGRSVHPTMPIYAYCNMNYSHSPFHISKEDMKRMIFLSAEWGMSGVVFWGDNNDTRSQAACLGMRRFVDSVLGPLVLHITKAADRCSAVRCTYRGRCIGKIIECLSGSAGGQRNVEAPSAGERRADSGSSCHCQCYAGWGGIDCSEPVNGKENSK